MFNTHDTTFLRYVVDERHDERRRAAAELRLARRTTRRRLPR
jgi:hypothetical protein